MATPLPEDILVTRFKDRCALAVSSNDPDAGMQLLRDFHAVAGKLYLSIISPQIAATASSPQRPPNAEKPAFVGRPLQAKFAGRCAVCGLGFGVGSPIVYNGDQKRAAHEKCGEAG